MYTIDQEAITLLTPLYNAPGRYYHDLNHIYYCISKLDEYHKHNSLSLDEVKQLSYSIWFHDAIYSPFPYSLSSNEEESAELFKNFAIKNISKWFYPDPVIYTIASTKHHLDTLTNFPYKITPIMLDIDMSGFARSFSEVYKDSSKIFKEYECLGLPEDVMLTHRIAFLEKLLQKDRIYYTDYFYNTHEKNARDNIESVIELSKELIKS